jgi:ribosome recycling factor
MTTIADIKKDAQERMEKALHSLGGQLARIRTGRAHPSILDPVSVDYYGAATPIAQVANISVEDARTLKVTPWEKNMVPAVEKAIIKANLGLNPSSSGGDIRIPLPALTEETRKEMIKQAKAEAEHARVAVRNVRRDANQSIAKLLKDKLITEDEERKANDEMQKVTDKAIADVDLALAAKEKDLMQI